MASILNKIENKHPRFRRVFNRYRKVKYSFKSFLFMRRASRRGRGKKDRRFLPLLDYKDKHNGGRCFIVATGPSLTYNDLDLIRDEITFSMNSIVFSYESTSFRPTYYGIQDPFVFEKVYETLLKYYENGPIFYASGMNKNLSKPHAWVPIPVNADYHLYDLIFEKKYFARFSANAYHLVYDGFSITYSLIQLAVFMGFKEIYLLGCDCNYSADPNRQHFIETGVFDPTFSEAGKRMIVAYMEAKKFADKNGIKIFNATRGGQLEVFPRVNLDDVVGADR